MKEKDILLCIAAIIIVPALAACNAESTTETPTPTEVVEVLPIPEFPAGEPVVISTIKMFTGTTGWAIGGDEDHGDLVLVTQDGGDTWTDASPPEPLSGDMKKAIGFFLDADTAWVTYSYANTFTIPENPVVWYTGDGGGTWEAKGTLDTAGLVEFYSPQHFTFADADNGWLMVIVGAGMNKAYFLLFHTEDGGANWALIQDPTSGSGMDSCPKTGMAFGDADTGWVTRDCAGLIDGAHVFVTGDGGDVWDYIELPPPAYLPEALMMPYMCQTHSPNFTSPTSGLIAVSCVRFNADDTKTESHFIYTSGDSGMTWQGGTPYPGGKIMTIGDGVAYAFGKDISRSTDGGATWAYVSSIDWKGQFSFIDQQRGWAVARSEDNVALVKTSNGGATWDLIEPSLVE